MKEFLIFQFQDNQHFDIPTSVTVIFCHQKDYASQQNISDEVKLFFQEHTISDKLLVILPAFASSSFKSFFADGKEETFKRIPSKGAGYLDSSFFIYEFDQNGVVTPVDRRISEDEDGFFGLLFRCGNCEVFVKGNGLVESSSDHHFVFPSGKHSAKFIRTGNILVNSPEIFFLAFQLLRFIGKVNHIYCDTSSINVLPYATLELKRRFGRKFTSPTINSFASYSVFEARKIPFQKDSLVLVSASTSGNIIERLLKDKLAVREQILVLYFLGSDHQYNAHSSSILCNLTRSQNFTQGVDKFETFKTEDKCDLCIGFSRPVAVLGDVFLTIQSRIQTVLISTDHCPKYLNSFVKNYRGRKAENVVIKTYYKENDPNQDYEVFIDTKRLFNKMTSGEFPEYARKINRLINVSIPANVKYLLHLPDEGSKILADYILSRINCTVLPEIIHIGEIDKVKDKEGSAVVVASSIVTGRHLLHVSRSLRKSDKLSIIYFLGVSRAASELYSTTLKSNLVRGKDSSDLRPVIAVEELTCSNEKNITSWRDERVFWENVIDQTNDTEQINVFAKARRHQLLSNKETIGLFDNVFLPKTNGTALQLRKGFAFWNFDYKEAEIFQSEVYFTISSIINNLEHKDAHEKGSLRQTNYIRNLLSPDNFHRYNDGIIQAAILRSGRAECFAYDLDSELSLKMKSILESMIDEHDKDHGEGLLEFLLAIGSKKLRLKHNDLIAVLNATELIEVPLINQMARHVRAAVIPGVKS